ncbi:MAG TPA: hypothetical protein VFH63_00760 [candidate division Zixibacteria bacterium]|nr:hypothetical protein [candidate division Zixibacteria bacterium]
MSSPPDVPDRHRPAARAQAVDESARAAAIDHIAVWGDADPAPFAVLAEEAVKASTTDERRRRRRPLAVARQMLVGLAALWVFLVALALMKDGSRGLAPALGEAVGGVLDAVGIGWLGSLLVLSGSPVAASALALFDGEFLDVDEAYGMIVGSRLGAAFVVLVVGAAYALTGRAVGRRAPISIGVLALSLTAIIYLPGGIAGLLLLRSGVLDSLSLTPPPVFFDLTDAATAPVVRAIESALRLETGIGAGLTFVAGLLLLLASFRLVDVLLPQLNAADTGARARWYVGPWTMFGIGLAVALATLSVSVALSLLVPAVSRGFLRREQILPYIAGANITTLVDTLLVAILLGNDAAPRIVLSLAAGITLVTLLILALAYRSVRRGVFRMQEVVLVSPARLAAFVGIVFAVPLLLLLAS